MQLLNVVHPLAGAGRELAPGQYQWQVGRQGGSAAHGQAKEDGGVGAKVGAACYHLVAEEHVKGCGAGPILHPGEPAPSVTTAAPACLPLRWCLAFLLASPPLLKWGLAPTGERLPACLPTARLRPQGRPAHAVHAASPA